MSCAGVSSSIPAELVRPISLRSARVGFVSLSWLATAGAAALSPLNLAPGGLRVVAALYSHSSLLVVGTVEMGSCVSGSLMAATLQELSLRCTPLALQLSTSRLFLAVFFFVSIFCPSRDCVLASSSVVRDGRCDGGEGLCFV